MHKCWEYLTPYMTRTDGASDNDNNLFIPLEDGKIKTIDSDGNILWNLELGGTFISKLNLKEDVLTVTNRYVIGKTIQRNLSANSGKIYKTHTNNSPSGFYLFGDKNSSANMLVLNVDGEIIKYLDDKQISWKKNLNSRITTEPFEFREQIVVGTANNTLIFIGRTDGNINAQINLKSKPTGKTYLNGRILYIGDERGLVYALDLETKQILWKTETGGKIVEIDIWSDHNDRYLLVSSNDNYVYLISEKNGDKVWKVLLPGRIIGKDLLDKNIAVYLSYATNLAIFIELKSGKIINKLSMDEDIYFVSKPLKLKDKIILPTQKGLYSYSSLC